MKLFRIFILTLLLAGLTIAGPATSGRHNLVKPKTAPSLTVGSVPVSHPMRDEPDETIFIEDFEEGMEGWTTHDLTEPDTAWHQSNYMTDDDDLLWWCGDTLTQYDEEPIGYDNIWVQYLDSPVLDLSNAGDNLTLTFDAYWLLEDPRRVPPPDGWDGWDGWLVMISEDGGEEFDVLYPEAPEYTADHLSAADRFWDLGELPGWVFESEPGGRDDWEAADDTVIVPHWVDVQFDLSDFNAEETVLRFILITDRTVSAPWNFYLSNSGVFVDNILLTDDDEEVYLFYDGVQDPFPADLIPHHGPGFGDFWELTDGEGRQHSGEWSMWNDDDHRRLVNALDSPPFEMPEDLNIWFEFWVWCDMPDNENVGGAPLQDYYEMYISNDEGESWERITYDYNRAGSGGDGWFHYVPGTPYDENINLDLSDYEGETIQLRWAIRTDGDDDYGNGNGLFIDDIEVLGTNLNNRDVGMNNLHLPYPTTVGMRCTGFTVDCNNYGLHDQTSIWARWEWGNEDTSGSYPIIPHFDVDSGELLEISISDYEDGRNPGWTPIVAGIFDVTTYTQLGQGTPDDDSDDDENLTNDTASVSDVRVWPSGLYELGHDNRTYDRFLNFDRGQGAAAKFSPIDHEIETYSLAATQFLFFNAQDVTTTFRLHVLGEGEARAPGGELISFEVDVPVDSCLPNHMTVPLYEYEELRGLSGDFWIWIEIMRDDFWPQIIGDELIRGEEWYYNHDGENTTPFGRDMLIHPIIVSTGEVVIDLAGSMQRVEFDAVFEGTSGTQSFTLYSIGLLPVTVENVTSSNEVFTVDWPGEATLGAANSVTFDITYTPPENVEHEGLLQIESDDETPPQISLIGFGTHDVGEPEETLPVKFELTEPYPNPFNSLTCIIYGLETSGETSLELYDLSGRMVGSLVRGWMPAGQHITTLKAGNLPSGVYLLKLKSGGKTAVKKVALLR